MNYLRFQMIIKQIEETSVHISHWNMSGKNSLAHLFLWINNIRYEDNAFSEFANYV